MHDDDEEDTVSIDMSSIDFDNLTYNTVDTTLAYPTVYNVSTSPSTITLTSPEEEVFIKTPDYDSKKVRQELGIDMIQNVKRKFENE